MPDARLEQLTDFTFAYAGGPRFYVGFATVPRTASGSGVGSESASGQYFRVRTASGSGVGSGSASYTEILIRTATGSGAGTTGEGTSELLIARRTATGSGTGSSSVLSGLALKKGAFGSGTGTQSATRVLVAIRTATGSGVGTESNTELMVAKRTATGSGTGSGTATAIEKLPRTATGTGTGSTGADATWNKLFIFRPPINDSFGWGKFDEDSPENSLFRRLVRGDRAKNVYKLTNGTFTTNQPSDPSEYTVIYWGAHANFVSAEEKADLIAAGYGANVT